MMIGRRGGVILLSGMLIVLSLGVGLVADTIGEKPSAERPSVTPAVATASTGPNSVQFTGFRAGHRGWTARPGTSVRVLSRHRRGVLQARALLNGTPLRVLGPVLTPGRSTLVTATVRVRSVTGPSRLRLVVTDSKATRVAATRSRATRHWKRIRVSYRLATETPVRIRINARATDKSHRTELLIDWVRITQTEPAQGAAADVAGAHCSALDYADPEQGALDWSDDFSGTTVDSKRWRVRNNESLSYDQARILKDNVTVGSGLLAITARRQNEAGRSYTTGYLDSIGKYSRQWGRWEVRAKLPTTVGSSRGVWPAFWLRGDTSPGELDVVEAWGEPTTRSGYRSGSYQWTVHQDTGSAAGTERRSGWGTSAKSSPVSDAFHLYAVDWSPSCVVYSFDHHVVGIVRASSTPWLSTALSGAFNIRLNLQIGQKYWGFTDPSHPELTALPTSLLVDYVRVYRPAWSS